MICRRVCSWFTSILNPVHGNCYMFNSGWNDTRKLQSHRTGRRFGKQFCVIKYVLSNDLIQELSPFRISWHWNISLFDSWSSSLAYHVNVSCNDLLSAIMLTSRQWLLTFRQVIYWVGQKSYTPSTTWICHVHCKTPDIYTVWTTLTTYAISYSRYKCVLIYLKTFS